VKRKIVEMTEIVKETLSNAVISTKIVKKFSSSPHINHDLDFAICSCLCTKYLLLYFSGTLAVFYVRVFFILLVFCRSSTNIYFVFQVAGMNYLYDLCKRREQSEQSEVTKTRSNSATTKSEKRVSKHLSHPLCERG
jgi:hypothetical protein